MEFVDPIRDIESINIIKEILRKNSQRDVLLFVFGINSGIRVSDLLSLKFEDIWDGEGVKEFLYLKDLGDGEARAYYINGNVKLELMKYLETVDLKETEYLFKSKKNDQPITRQQAYRIINSAARKVGIPGKIGTHTLRKTFGYHAYRKGIAISILMEIYRHHTPSETLRYIGIDHKEESLVKVDVNL